MGFCSLHLVHTTLGKSALVCYASVSLWALTPNVFRYFGVLIIICQLDLLDLSCPDLQCGELYSCEVG